MGQGKIAKKYRQVVDNLRDETVINIFSQATAVEEQLKKFKQLAISQIDAYMDLLAQEYKAPYSGKGNLTLTNYDGTLKIERAMQDFLVFDEKLQVAKELIDKCIKKWSNDINENIKVLVLDAFQVDKKGKISTERVLGLKRLAIKDADWVEAMKAITDSVSVSSSKMYIRFYKREDEYAQWKQVTLNLASI